VLRQLAAAEGLMLAVDQALAAAGLPIGELTVAADPVGEVCVFGVTASEDAKQRAGEIARTVPGVARVLNTILVVGESEIENAEKK
jgi:hypothetical protein